MIGRAVSFTKDLIGLGKGHERSKLAKKNIIASFLIKGLSILISLMLVPMTINYVNPTKYGIWLTLSSIIGWFAFFDIGFGNGLRNKFAVAKTTGNTELARAYVSTTYAFLTIIIGVVLGLFLILNPFLNWSGILNTTPQLNGELKLLALIVFTFFCIQFIMQLITTILIADQKPAKASFFNLLGSIFSLVAIFIITKTTKGSLLYLGTALSLSPILVLAICSLWFYSKDYREYAPSLKYVKFSYAKELLNLGIKFFIIQISTVFLYQTNNLIITQLFGPTEVTTFNIAFKYFGIIPMIFSIITVPFWSAYTEAFVKMEYDWIKRTIKILFYLWMGICFLSILMIIFANLIYKLWVGKDIIIPFSLSVVCALYGIIVTWSTIFLNFINGVGKIKLQLYLIIIAIFLNIPLAVYLAKYLHFGVSGVLLATCINFMMFAIIIPLQYQKIINNKAEGIWNK